MGKFASLLTQLESNLIYSDKINIAISKASVGWHIEHSLLAFNNIINSLKKSNPAEYKWQFNTIRIFVFIMNKIPRGKGKAPQASLPAADIQIETLKNYLEIARINFSTLDSLDSKTFFVHPVFGNLDLKATKKLLIIHTRHHLDIIADIVKEVK